MNKVFSKYTRFGLDDSENVRTWIDKIGDDVASGMSTSDILKKYEKGNVEPNSILSMIDYINSMDAFDSYRH